MAPGPSHHTRPVREHGGVNSAPPEPAPTELAQLLDVVARFRGEGGCAWYEAQTHEGLVPYLIEETAELVEALEVGDAADMREELGDVLFQVLFHADIAAQRPDPAKRFTLEDVARDQREKLIRRNPHVFGDRPTREMDEIIRMWMAAKVVEKAHRTSVLAGVPRTLDGVARAVKVLSRAERVGVTPAARTPAPAVREVHDSGQATVTSAADTTEAERAVGDELLAVIAEARNRGIDPDRALRGAVRRIEARVTAREGERREG